MLLKNWDVSLQRIADCIITAHVETSTEAFKIQGNRVQPVLLHAVSAFASEPASRFAATLVLKAFCGVYFIDSLFPDCQSFYFTSLFSPSQSIWFAPGGQPGLTLPGQPGLASRYFLGGTVSTLLFFVEPNDTTAAFDSTFDPKQ